MYSAAACEVKNKVKTSEKWYGKWKIAVYNRKNRKNHQTVEVHKCLGVIGGDGN